MDNALVDALVEQVNLSRKSDVSFKPEAYKATIAEISVRCGVHLENKHISNRLRTFKKFYWAVKDMLNTSGFGWNPVVKMVIATDDVWEAYIASHPYAERVQGKHINRYNDLSFMFGSDCAQGFYANTAYSSSISGRRRPRDEVDSSDEFGEDGNDTVRLSSDDDDENGSGSVRCPNEESHKQTKRVHTGPMETSFGSRNNQSTGTGMTRQQRVKLSDQIRDKMGEAAENVRSLTITMATGKTMTLQKILSILEDVNSLS
ncbi:uncharacterized protein LOC131231819 [Magnolia sinica]|uniref:uncharacterized protein LOC131231819 n=1 Tax=Magnolia sinica TaxID=86752 RepID=UPI00265B091C|nr:uncharacterized protein LOC131231819 [Magnolia sinica]